MSKYNLVSSMLKEIANCAAGLSSYESLPSPKGWENKSKKSRKKSKRELDAKTDTRA